MKIKRKIEKMNSTSASMRAYEVLKEKILKNEFSSPQNLKENVLTEELNLSRTPIRESLIMLMKEDLLMKDGRGGFRIKQFSLKDINDLYEFRELVEIATASLIVSKITDENIEMLFDVLKEIWAIVKKGKAPEAFAKGVQFHRQIVNITGNSILIEVMNNCYDKLTLVGWSCQRLSMCKKSCEEHKEILAALKEKNVKKLQEKFHNHILNAKSRAINILTSDTEKWFFVP